MDYSVKAENILKARQHWRTRASRRVGNPMPMGFCERLKRGIVVHPENLRFASAKTKRRIAKYAAGL